MKTSVITILCIFFVIALLTVSCVPEQAEEVAVEPEKAAVENELIGVWKLIEVKLPAFPEENLEAGTITNPQPSIDIYTKEHFMWMGVRGEQPRPDLPEDPTDAQLLEALRPFDGEAGTYEVNGSTITQHIIVARSPNDMNSQATIHRDFRFEGEELILSFKFNPDMPDPIELKFTRLE